MVLDYCNNIIVSVHALVYIQCLLYYVHVLVSYVYTYYTACGILHQLLDQLRNVAIHAFVPLTMQWKQHTETGSSL